MFLKQREYFDELRSILGPNGLALLDDIQIEPIREPEADEARKRAINFTLLGSGQVGIPDDLRRSHWVISLMGRNVS